MRLPIFKSIFALLTLPATLAGAASAQYKLDRTVLPILLSKHEPITELDALEWSSL